MVNTWIQNYDELRVYEFIQEFTYEPVIEHYDFTTLPLTKESPIFEIGRKKEALYTDESGNIVVKKLFKDITEGLEITIQWMKYDDTVGLEKVFIKPLSLLEKGDLLRKRRQRSISYMQVYVKGTPVEPIVTLLLEHYRKEVDLYIQGATSHFQNALDSELDPTFIGYLNIDVNGLTIKQNIEHNITPIVTW